MLSSVKGALRDKNGLQTLPPPQIVTVLASSSF